jgi:hypothetical protein
MLRGRYAGLAASLLVSSLFTSTQAQSSQLTESSINPTKHATQFVPENQPRRSNQPETTATNADTDRSPDAKESVNTTPTPAKARLSQWMKLLPLPPVNKLSLIEKAYLDVYAILHEDNQCSRFYGGPVAVEALNELARQLKTTYFDSSIGVRMAGAVSNTSNYSTGLSYRLFETAELNINGPFFRSNGPSADTTIPRIGEFSPNTREARMAIILHEIGHLIRVGRDEWVLPNDGNDPRTSKRNTLKVVDMCRDQIKSRSHVSFEDTLAQLRADELRAVPLDISQTTVAHSVASSESVRQNGTQLDARCESCRREIQIPQDH